MTELIPQGLEPLAVWRRRLLRELLATREPVTLREPYHDGYAQWLAVQKVKAMSEIVSTLSLVPLDELPPAHLLRG